jgi:hypothetical protein
MVQLNVLGTAVGTSLHALELTLEIKLVRRTLGTCMDDQHLDVPTMMTGAVPPVQ